MEKFIVYNNFMGTPEKVVPLDGKWWVITRDQILSPLPKGLGDTDVYSNLCSLDEELNITDLAGIMGSSMINPEPDIYIGEILENRFKELLKMGVKVNASLQQMDVTVHIVKNPKGNKRTPYCVSCYHSHDEWKDYFYLENIKSAITCACCAHTFVNFFKNHGVRVNATLKCTEEVYNEVAMLMFDMLFEEITD